MAFFQVLSGNAMVSSLFLLLGGTTYRLIYDATLDTRPNTVIFVNTTFFFIAGVTNLIVFANRDLFAKRAEHDRDLEKSLESN